MDRFANGYALLIAVNDNRMPGYSLPTVANDVAALRRVLIHPDRCAYRKENVRLLQGAEATRNGIREGLDWLRQQIVNDASGNATAFIYYTGHGARNAADESYYLIPYDLEPPVMQSAMAAAEFAAAVDAVRARRTLVVLDCCHAAGMGVKSLVKGDDPLKREGLTPAALTPRSRDVAALGAGRGRAILSSSTNEEQSYIRPDMSMSIFTYHLVEALTGHAEPMRGARDILVSDVMSYVSRTVPASARDAYKLAQTPSFHISGENFPVALLLGGRGLEKGVAAPDPLRDELLTAAASEEPSGGGIYIAGSLNSAGGSVVGRDATVAGNMSGGSSYVLSGDFRGAMVNVDSTMQNVIQRIGAAPTTEPADRAELIQALAGLRAELAQVPESRGREVEIINRRLQTLTDELGRNDREMMQLLGDSMERAADSLSDIRPSARDAAAQTAAVIRRIARA